MATRRTARIKLELACGDYDLAKEEARKKGAPHSVTIAIIERRYGLPRGALENYRANHLSRHTRTKSKVKRNQLSAILFMPVKAVAALWAFILAMFNAAPVVEPQAQQAATAMASLAVPAVVAVTGTASAETDEEDCAFDFVEDAWQHPDPPQPQAKTKKAAAHRQPHRANAVQRLADKTVNRQLQGLRRAVRHLVSRR